MQVSKKWLVAGSVVGAFMLIMGFITRAWVHDLFMIAYVNPFPTLLGLVAIGFIGYDLFFRSGQNRPQFVEDLEPSWISLVAVVAIVLVSLGYVIFEPWYYGKTLYGQTKFEAIQKMPASNAAMTRVLPFAVANKYADDSFDEPTEKLGTNHLQVIDGKLVNVLPQVPEGLVLYFTKHMSGAKLVDAGMMDKDIKTVTKEVAVSENVGITDNVYWQIYNRDYWVDIREVLYIPYQNEINVVVPYMKYTGFFVRVPYFAGVYVFDSAGNMRNYTPEEAAKLPFIKGNRVYPEWLVRQQVESYRFVHGIRNYLFTHDDQIEVGSPTGNNPYPYFIPTDSGMKWMVPAQPRGASYALMKVFFADAVTGKMQIYSVPKGSNLTGAEKALGYVNKEMPTVSWSDFSNEEPRPVITPDNTLWWMASVVPKDYSGVSRTVFINTKTNEVRVCENLSQVLAFISGQTGQALLAKPGLTTNTGSNVSTSSPSVEGTSTKAILEQIEHIKKELSELENSFKK